VLDEERKCVFLDYLRDVVVGVVVRRANAEARAPLLAFGPWRRIGQVDNLLRHGPNEDPAVGVPII
jgi:hypothetical protein